MQKNKPGDNHMIVRRIGFFIACWMFLVVLMSSTIVRNWLAVPLVVHDQNARGDACYVLAGGGAIWERLDAASDLVQMGRVSRMVLMQDNSRGQYSFKANSPWNRSQWIADYLSWRGIAPDKIIWIQQTEGLFGTLVESRAVAKNLPKNIKTLVIVSSAPHMRRSVLAFKRALSSEVDVVPYAATAFENSYERHHPLWIEYLKLLVYSVIA
jgi:uncharacterized SAM-binding protein YcdF (DUF218 family)